MPIVSHTLEQESNPDGSSHNILRMYDQDAREYMVSWHAPAGFNNAAKIDIAIADQDEQLKVSEFESIFGAG